MAARAGRRKRGASLSVGVRLLRAGAIGVSATVGLAATTLIVLIAEGLIVRERLEPTRVASVPLRRGCFGEGGPRIELGMLGDSLAVGYGADHPDRTPGVLLAKGLAEASGQEVGLTNVAEVGAESSALRAQVAKLLDAVRPDVAVIVVGANDVMHLKRLTDALSPLSAAVHALRDAGAQVVVATCPDLGIVHPFSQPLRFVAHWYSRVMATGQAIVVLRAGGRSVSLADTLGTLFRDEAATMFSAHDHLHPSDLGYEAAASVILPSVRVAAGHPLPLDAHLPHRIYQKGRAHPLAWWAFRASRRVGERLTAAAAAAALPADAAVRG